MGSLPNRSRRTNAAATVATALRCAACAALAWAALSGVLRALRLLAVQEYKARVLKVQGPAVLATAKVMVHRAPAPRLSVILALVLAAGGLSTLALDLLVPGLAFQLLPFGRQLEGLVRPATASRSFRKNRNQKQKETASA